METITINKFQISGDMNDPKVFDQILYFANLVIDSGSKGDTYHFVQDLERMIIKTNLSDAIRQRYLDLLLRLRIESFQLLSDREFEEILKSKISYLYKNNIDLRPAMNLMFLPEFGVDTDKLNRLLRYFEDNTELIGTTNIKVSDKVVAPLIKNWLKDYKAEITDDKGSLNVVTYITKNQNSQKLAKENINFLRYVISFYDWMRFKAGKVSFIENDLIEPIQPKSPEPPLVKTQLAVQPPPAQAIPNPAKEMTAFEKRLAEVSAKPQAAPHGADLEALKHRMEAQPVIKPTTPPAAPKPQVDMVKEIKREVSTRELPPHESAIPMEIKKVTPPPPAPTPPPIAAPKPKPVPQPMPRVSVEPKPPVGMGVALNDMRTINDLKKLDLSHLRLGPTAAQIQNIKNKIIDLAHANRVLPYYVLSAFEESPLYRAYLNHGNAIFTGAASNTDLTKEEFEAIADLRKEIQRL